MHRYILFLLPLVLIAALLAGCSAGSSSSPQGAPDEDAARYDHTDSDAPKVIQSTQIISFDCRFTTLDTVLEAPEGASPLAAIPTMGRQACHLNARLENGAVIGLYEIRTPTRTVSRTFRASHDFMDELQGLVGEQYDLAQYNGINVEVKGLPDGLGASLDVVYGSGEAIHASDNQSGFLTLSAMSALDWLFASSSAYPPDIIDLSVSPLGGPERTESGAFIDVTWPELTLGYRLSDGELVLPNGRDALVKAVDAVNAQERELAEQAKARLAGGKGELYWNSDAVICRSDSDVVSFYVKNRRYEDAGWEKEMTEFRAYDLDPVTGQTLGFSDVFRDMQLLPGAITAALAETYPEQTFYDDAIDFITQSVLNDDGNVSFALSYGCVHIFINEYIVSDAPGGHHVTIPFTEQPYLVRPFYTGAPLRGIVPLDYGTHYGVRSGLGFRMDCKDLPGQGVLWTLDTDDGHHAEKKLYGSAPDCWLVWDSWQYFIYRRVSTGDVSMCTDVLQLSEQGILPLGELGMALNADTPCDPDRMMMSVNEIVSVKALTMIPYGIYQLGRDGLPEFVGGAYELRGNAAEVRESCRVNPPDRAQAAVSGGMWNLVEGETLTPWQTDLASWIIFRTEDERLCYFEIDGFSDRMHLDNFGTLDEFLRPAGSAG